MATDGGKRRLWRRPAVYAVRFFPLRRGGEALVLKKGQSDHHQHGMVVKAMPAPPFEVIEAEFFLHLLVALFADPARLGPGGKNRQSCVGRQIAQVVLGVPVVASLRECPEFRARRGGLIIRRSSPSRTARRR